MRTQSDVQQCKGRGVLLTHAKEGFPHKKMKLFNTLVRWTMQHILGLTLIVTRGHAPTFICWDIDASIYNYMLQLFSEFSQNSSKIMWETIIIQYIYMVNASSYNYWTQLMNLVRRSQWIAGWNIFRLVQNFAFSQIERPPRKLEPRNFESPAYVHHTMAWRALGDAKI